ncbi:MAG: acetylornithine deacetylase/succinyldiaminopimelate desuccinylase-like deacylase [Alphaproteobacteria bacterium]|nr:acetylornithine deacetylase/succinyldiaminopimelate desuccinylase-like deacylase [Alphaproteobacteria bacterium]
MDFNKAAAFLDRIWDDEIVPKLTDYIRIPNKSPAFDPDWEANGFMEQAVTMFADWARGKLGAFPGATLEVVRLAKRTPLIFIEIPGSAPGIVLMYGHLDKQPEMLGWAEGLGPWEPALKDGKLYGRGGADDGYALFASLAALLALKQQGVAHARTVIIIEASEESGSPDLPFYIDHLAARIGEPDLVVCLDSGAGNYEQLWLTTSLRGMVIGTLSVRVLTEGVHSGAASGIVPSSFRILRHLLSRIENPETGEMLLPDLKVAVPRDRQIQAKQAAAILGSEVWSELPFAGTTKPMGSDGAELILQKTWQPQLAITAMEGYPLPENGGNVLLPYSIAKLSLRVPPSADAEAARQAVKIALEASPPYDAEVVFDAPRGENGWNAPTLAPWLEASLNKASNAAYGKPVAFQGEGGSIPFMAMLGEKFPKTQFVVTGVLGPHSNAHGPNEFLHIPFAKRVSACIAGVLADHAAR